EEKLESLRRCVRRIEHKCPPKAEALDSDWDLQDIIAINLTRAVQLSVDIAAHVLSEAEGQAPGTMAQSFENLAHAGVIPAELAIRLKKAVGFRNIAVHNYQAIDWRIVHLICTQHLDDFKEFAACVMKNRIDT
ncbi:MAG: type VII toxin-antitoxin system HepT family RNase toxin, partial [Gammaproteobacteria bacterium]